MLTHLFFILTFELCWFEKELISAEQTVPSGSSMLHRLIRVSDVTCRGATLILLSILVVTGL